MSEYTSYDPIKKPEVLMQNKSPIRSTNIATNNIPIPRKQEAEEYNPQIQRRTIKVEKTQGQDLMKESKGTEDGRLRDMQKRYKDSYNLANTKGDTLYADTRNQVYNYQALSPQPILNGSAINPEALKQLLSLQMQLQQNPNLIQQTQNLIDNLHNSNPTIHSSVKSQNNNLLHAMGELEREVNSLRIENNRFKQTIDDLEYELSNTKQQLSIEKNKNNNLNHDLESHQDLRDKLDEYALEIQKLESERDFHHKNHIELRKELYNKTSAEFQINKLKRDLHYKIEQQNSLQERCVELEAQVNELLVFAEKPRNDKKQTSDEYYTKRIVELENAIKKLKEEKFELENFHNTSLDNRKFFLSDANNKLDKTSDVSKTQQMEVDMLKRRVEILKMENDQMKKQLENAKGAKRADNFTINNDESERHRQMINTYIKEIEELKNEVRKLKNQPIQTESSNLADFYMKTIEEQKMKITSLQQEKTALQIKIDTLNRELMEKNREVSEMKQTNGYGVGDQTVDQLRDANKRMTIEIGRLQDQLRKLDSFSKNSMLSDNKERNWNKLL